MKQLIKITFYSLIFIFFSCENKKPKNELVDDFSDKIDSLISTTKTRKFNGVVLITQNEKTLYSKEYGFSDFENKTPISLNDNFRIQSNSKLITATLILKEVEKGNIDLNKPIKNYLPKFKTSWADTVTVHQLLNMSSGIIDIEKPLIFEAGKGYKYSNPGYGLLGSILENVTGKTFSECANNLFQELGMNNTYCNEFGKPNKGIVNGYTIKNEKVSYFDVNTIGFDEESWKDFIPAGGIISNVYDLNLWDSKLHKGKILSPESYKKMITPTNKGPHAVFDNDTLGYGYGIRIHNRHKTSHMGHGGRGLGFVSLKFYIPKNDVDVIIWENVYCMDDNWIGGNTVYHFENEIRKIVVNSNLGK